MKNSLIVLALCAGILLTGCGKDAVLRQAESEKAQFTSSIYEVKTDAGAENVPLTNLKEKGELVNRVQQVLIDSSAETLPDGEKEVLDFGYERDEKTGELLIPDWSDWNSIRERAYTVGVEAQNDEIEVDEKYRSIAGCYILDSERSYTREDMTKLLTQLEGVGISGLANPFEAYADEHEKAGKKSGYGSETDISLVRQGIEFTFQRVYLEDGVGQGVENEYYLDVQVPQAMLLVPEKYKELTDKGVKDGFYVSAINAGGYMDRLNFISSWDEWGNPYNKCIDFYYQDDKPLELEIKMEKNANSRVDAASTPLFTENEKETMTNLVAEICGDESSAAAFVSDFLVGKEKEGSVGRCRWTLEKKYGYEYLVIEAESE